MRTHKYISTLFLCSWSPLVVAMFSLTDPPAPQRLRFSSAREILRLRDFLLALGLFRQHDSSRPARGMGITVYATQSQNASGRGHRSHPDSPSHFANRETDFEGEITYTRSKVKGFSNYPLFWFSNFTTLTKLFVREEKIHLCFTFTFSIHFKVYRSVSAREGDQYHTLHFYMSMLRLWGRSLCSASSRARTPTPNFRFRVWGALPTHSGSSSAFIPQKNKVWKLLTPYLPPLKQETKMWKSAHWTLGPDWPRRLTGRSDQLTGRVQHWETDLLIKPVFNPTLYFLSVVLLQYSD